MKAMSGMRLSENREILKKKVANIKNQIAPSVPVRMKTNATLMPMLRSPYIIGQHMQLSYSIFGSILQYGN